MQFLKTSAQLSAELQTEQDPARRKALKNLIYQTKEHELGLDGLRGTPGNEGNPDRSDQHPRVLEDGRGDLAQVGWLDPVGVVS